MTDRAPRRIWDRRWGTVFQVLVVAAATMVLAAGVWLLAGSVLDLGGSHASLTGTAVTGRAANGDAAKRLGGPVTLSASDVTDALATLSLDGQDVPVSLDGVSVYLDSNGIWVEQRGSVPASGMADVTARRCFALAAWASGTGVNVPQVTWIVEDESGVVHMTMSASTTLMTKARETEGLLKAALGYRISGDAYAALSDPGFDRALGVAPKLPTGEDIPIEATSRAAGAQDDASLLSSHGGTDTNVPSPGRGGAAATIEVTVDVPGSSGVVSVPAGASAYDALLATGADVTSGPSRFGSGTWVYGINGIGSAHDGAGRGWTYTVNGSSPSLMSDEYAVSAGDVIRWRYV
ncbi:DUF4430 domain-containing protein [Olsenella sp. HMSC062G07]|uniref:DUF4430 domain-containing protein n=1 Tax=Olsenella sp. HMSC062G07 TaxID=1739330 RepID=UPI0008A4D4BD|nr:DUF4430 domain-containing protein [Olsenella sp. HMSC062G07]OFK23338.1 hypothetical protein HMPREF2826_05375 [Olsenella sp. HMSC062G07]